MIQEQLFLLQSKAQHGLTATKLWLLAEGGLAPLGCLLLAGEGGFSVFTTAGLARTLAFGLALAAEREPLGLLSPLDSFGMKGL